MFTTFLLSPYSLSIPVPRSPRPYKQGDHKRLSNRDRKDPEMDLGIWFSSPYTETQHRSTGSPKFHCLYLCNIRRDYPSDKREEKREKERKKESEGVEVLIPSFFPVRISSIFFWGRPIHTTECGN